jgi:hypothetical protein
MSPLPNEPAMTQTEDYIPSLCAFLKTQDFLDDIDIDAVRAARSREDLGITSLGVIMLVANYMEAHGVANAEFNPDWITKLDSIDGIIAVFREIDHDKSKQPSQ